MITLESNELVFRFDDVHPEAVCKVGFQRTLRIPDNDKEYPLPAGLGLFELRHIDDFASKLPHTMVRRGGIVMPMWQAEAMWLNFGRSNYSRRDQYPFAIKIAAGKINAVTGETWRDGLHADPQDYITVPNQPWLDGFCVKKGTIRQFVATELGRGETVEEQITGQAENGGLQIIAYPMKRAAYKKLYAERLQYEMQYPLVSGYMDSPNHLNCASDMGFAAGGQMRQEIYSDPLGLDVWDQERASRCFATVLNAQSWNAITGTNPSSPPPSSFDYKQKGLPWFDYYAADQKALEGSSILSRLKSFAKFGAILDKSVATHVAMSDKYDVISVGPNKRPRDTANQVREGSF